MAQPKHQDDTSGMEFSAGFEEELRALFHWRRDVRHFSDRPVPETLVHDLLIEAASYAPSVGLSQPTRFVYVESTEARTAALENFEACNASALNGYEGEQKQVYASLKLTGMKEAPVQIAAFCADSTAQGHGLGAATMPETLRYSVVCAIMQFWLSARAAGLGVGWVSILDPEKLSPALGAVADWRFIAYLCIGWPQEEHLTPELERAGWEHRRTGDQFISRA